MTPFPNPLHPAVAHFPIAFLLLGSAMAVLAVFARRWHLPLLTAVLLVCGAAGAAVATATGEKDSERVKISEAGEDVLDHHEDWGEITRNIAIAAALLSVVAALTANKHVVGRSFSVLTALCALAAAYAVAQTGHYGGELVYRHGAGVKISAGPASDANAAEVTGHKGKDNDD